MTCGLEYEPTRVKVHTTAERHEALAGMVTLVGALTSPRRS